ncbi:hypothetical protein [Pectobacterium phage PcCB7V]|nr:hypothetical protein [Pectobacterium phage PcCB7V]
MSYEPSVETFNVPHVVQGINGNILTRTYNYAQARQFSRWQDAFMMNTCTVRPADEDDVASFMRRLGDC